MNGSKPLPVRDSPEHAATGTARALASITDASLFERLAGAVLREAEPSYRRLVSTGINAAGKTIRGPVDGICFESGSDPPRMIAVHHTTTARNGLRLKWLRDPAKPGGSSSSSTQPPGDVVKTAALVAEERRRTPTLRATLVLTTNEEPDERLVRDVAATGRESGLDVDVWSRARLCHFLDTAPSGQWIRQQYLGIDQERLSKELLWHLSTLSLETYRLSLLDDSRAWVRRELDGALATGLTRDVTFLVAGSGQGKSVACCRRMEAHIAAGGPAIVLPHDVVASAVTLEEALVVTLRHLHPPLAATEASPLSFGELNHPLLLVVEDINRSGQAPMLVEKIAGWSSDRAESERGSAHSWRLVCPLWPDVLVSIREQSRRRLEALCMFSGAFVNSEGRDAVLARARLCGRKMTSLQAEAVSSALGHDPLLIALHQLDEMTDARNVIGEFVDGALLRTAAATASPATDYRLALRALAGQMLERRKLGLTWRQVATWHGLEGRPLSLLASLAQQGDLIRLIGSSDEQRLQFRHDRVRDWLLADALAAMDGEARIPDAIVGEPYFAEVIGAVLAQPQASRSLLDRVAMANPLALVCAFRLSGEPDAPHRAAIRSAIDRWLDNADTRGRSSRHLCWEGLAVLADTDATAVPDMVAEFPEQTVFGHLARLRNGDVGGGIDLCRRTHPGATAPWRDIQVDHAKSRFGGELAEALDGVLRRSDLDAETRQGALLMAGHLADSNLAPAIEACWATDESRCDSVDDYLWACAACCRDDPERFLSPICDEWARLPDAADDNRTPPRIAVSAYELNWAFRRWPPLSALDYLAQRGLEDDLRWPVTVLFHGVDHPRAVVFVARECAAIARRLEGTESFSPFLASIADDWQRAQKEHGRPMSRASRDSLRSLWQSEASDGHLRTQSFLLWAATVGSDDLDVLRAASASNGLVERILWARLARGDQEAIPEMIEKIGSTDSGYWWQCGRHIWSPELTAALDEFLRRRGGQAKLVWEEFIEADWITSEMVTRLPASQSEVLLLRHWSHLRFSPYFVQAALYASTPRLLEAAEQAIRDCPEPQKLMEHLHSRFAILNSDHPGVTREEQIRGLAAYMSLLSPLDIRSLWEACNDHGWFSLRREVLDRYLEPPYPRGHWDPGDVCSQLDNMVADKHPTWIDYWIDSYLAADVTWSEILEALRAWLHDRRSLAALELLARALEHRGTRSDLHYLKATEVVPHEDAAAVIADTTFAVRRRSIG